MSNQSTSTKPPLTLFDVLCEEYRQQNPPGEEPERSTPGDEPTVVPPQSDELQKTTDNQPVDPLTARTVEEFYQHLHQQAKAKKFRTALCFSGGGIRSATFNLGVLQGLARYVGLEKFHYLSTVSGGGYVGSWFSAWTHRRGLDRVQQSLKGNQPERTPLQPEDNPIFHLRRYSNYMSPRLGLLSADTWSLLAIYLRNLLLNWTVLLPLLMALLLLPRFMMSFACWDLVLEPAPFVKLQDWLGLELQRLTVAKFIFWVGYGCGVWGIAYIIACRPSSPGEPRLPNGQKLPSGEGGFLWLCWLPMLVLAITHTLYWVWIHDQNQQRHQSLFYDLVPGSALGFTYYGASLHLLGYVVAQFLGTWKRFKTAWRAPQRAGAGLAGVIVTGAFGGWLVWLLTQYLPNSTKHVQPGKLWTIALYVCLAVPLYLLAFHLATTLFIGIATDFTTDADREWLARAGAWLSIAIAVWLLGSGLVLFGPWALEILREQVTTAIPSLLLGLTTGAVTLFGGKSAQSAATTEQHGEEGKKNSLINKLLALALPFAAPLFLAFLLATISLGTSGLIAWALGKLTLLPLEFTTSTAPWHLRVLYYTNSKWLLITAAVVVALGGLMGWCINVNKYSLHGAYRDRLIRAYLGASRSQNRQPNPFTGLDERDNLQVHELLTDLYYADSFVEEHFNALCKRICHPQAPDSNWADKYVRQHLQDSEKNLCGSSMDQAQRKQLLANAFNLTIEEEDLLSKLDRDDDYKEWEKENKEVWEQKAHWWDQQPAIKTRRGLRFWQKKDSPVITQRIRIQRGLLDAAFVGNVRSLAESLKKPRPLHIINIALNLVRGKELAWQNRKAQSFTVSALHAGSYRDLGYRPTQSYAVSRREQRALSLGTALAISGAAASPNMGYHSSPVVTFLMALFNVRLGWWLANPKQQEYQRACPSFSPKPLLAETFGWTDNEHPYIYLSDGGHFENLGLYEMVLRRCHFIVVSDASCDPSCSFDDLGNAISKIRADLGIPIEFTDIPISPRIPGGRPFSIKEDAVSRLKYCATAKIDYRAIDGDEAEPGWLLYIKPAFYGIESADVINYALANPLFPHETTGDQMYSETQFESYRMLGIQVIEQMLCCTPCADFQDIKQQVEKYLKPSTTSA